MIDIKVCVMDKNVEFTRIFNMYSNDVKYIISKKYNSDDQLQSLVWEKIFNRINHKKLEYTSDIITLPYVRKLIKNTYLNFIKSERYRTLKNYESLQYNDYGNTEISDNLNYKIELNDEKIFKNIKPFEIQLIKLRFVENKSIKDINTTLNLSNSAVYLSRVLKKLKSNMIKYKGLEFNLNLNLEFI